MVGVGAVSSSSTSSPVTGEAPLTKDLIAHYGNAPSLVRIRLEQVYLPAFRKAWCILIFQHGIKGLVDFAI